VTNEVKNNYDVVVIGGGAAGLNGALMLARSRRRVLVVDAGRPRNAPAHAVHGLLGHDGVPPAELLARGRAEVIGYGGELTTGEVTAAAMDPEGFSVTLAGGRSARARRLLVATGLTDQLPDVGGLRERWGRDVIHCPYCHGWEVRGQAIGVLATGPMSVHQALLFRQLSEDVTYFSHLQPPDEEQAGQLAARSIPVIGGRVESVVVESGRLTGVRLAGGTVIARQAIAVSARMVARAGFLAGLGLEPAEHPSGMGEHVTVDATGRTTVPGVWAAGNVADIFAQVGAAAAAGALAGAHINADLVAEETRAAVAARAHAMAGPAAPRQAAASRRH
jgi:thioredoxin reductase